MHLCFHIPSCSTIPDPKHLKVGTLHCHFSCSWNFPHAHHAKTSDFTSLFSVGWLNSPPLDISKNECHSIEPVQKVKAGGRKITLLSKCLDCSTLQFLRIHSSSFTVCSVIYTTLETWRYNLAVNMLSAAQIIPKSRTRWPKFIAWWYTRRMYHSSYTKTFVLQLNIMLEAAT